MVDERERTKERKRSEAKRRQTQFSYSAVPYGHGRAWSARRTSIGVPPRLLLRRPNATAQLQSALPGVGPVSGRYPQTDPSQYSEAPRRPVTSVPIPKFAQHCGSLSCELRNQRDTSEFKTCSCGFGFEVPLRTSEHAGGTSNPPHDVPVGRVPEAARERVASPPAGTALAPCMQPAGRSPSDWARFGAYVTKSVTGVNDAVTRNFVILKCEWRRCALNDRRPECSFSPRAGRRLG
jgi:hypothetical protein